MDSSTSSKSTCSSSSGSDNGRRTSSSSSRNSNSSRNNSRRSTLSSNTASGSRNNRYYPAGVVLAFDSQHTQRRQHQQRQRQRQRQQKLRKHHQASQQQCTISSKRSGIIRRSNAPSSHHVDDHHPSQNLNHLSFLSTKGYKVPVLGDDPPAAVMMLDNTDVNQNNVDMQPATKFDTMPSEQNVPNRRRSTSADNGTIPRTTQLQQRQQLRSQSQKDLLLRSKKEVYPSRTRLNSFPPSTTAGSSAVGADDMIDPSVLPNNKNASLPKNDGNDDCDEIQPKQMHLNRQRSSSDGSNRMTSTHNGVTRRRSILQQGAWALSFANGNGIKKKNKDNKNDFKQTHEEEKIASIQQDKKEERRLSRRTSLSTLSTESSSTASSSSSNDNSSADNDDNDANDVIRTKIGSEYILKTRKENGHDVLLQREQDCGEEPRRRSGRRRSSTSRVHWTTPRVHVW